MIEVIFPRIRKQLACSVLIKPLKFFFADEKNPPAARWLVVLGDAVAGGGERGIEFGALIPQLDDDLAGAVFEGYGEGLARVALEGVVDDVAAAFLECEGETK